MKNNNKFLDRILEKISDKTIGICVVGIGRIGLPTAISFSNAGFTTIGVDINGKLVEEINNKIFPLKDEPGYEAIFLDLYDKQKISATLNLKMGVEKSDLILLSLPTPMDKNNIPNYSAIFSVIEELSRLKMDDKLIVIESTIEPGFVENELVPILESNPENKIGKNLFIGVCPENANPGEIFHDFNNLPRLIAGYDKETMEVLYKIYSSVFPVEFIKMSNCKTANAVKLTTNVFRDLNIAFVNELAKLYDKLGIDTFEVLNAAKRKYNFQLHYPGPGVGGPCLPVNSYQIINSSKKFDLDFLQLVKTGRKINESMPIYTVSILREAVKEINKKLDEIKVLILGISYKPNVKDIQISPAEKIIEILKNENCQIKIFDPYFINEIVFGIKTGETLKSSLEDVDVVILVTNHQEFEKCDINDWKNNKEKIIILDTRGVLNESTSKNIIFRGIGRISK